MLGMSVGQQFNTVLPYHGCFASGGRLRLDSWRRKGYQPSRKKPTKRDAERKGGPRLRPQWHEGVVYPDQFIERIRTINKPTYLGR